ncbi:MULTISPECIES: hypothetical protein [Enterococcus]|uniref:Lipoprotein n=3 Tax=Enterococcus TaxID=1350 RepID=A0A286KC96_ENTAV|nr:MULTISPECIES: hypothetical protein [Enterococcus]APB62453.1 hypothetical protein pEMA120_p42 [Enterococcus faecium]APB62539.1 hypothetical protein pEA19081_p43 [Enterococcus avium]EOF89256.1 hypothetical protein SKG_02712 [Enterococcus faecium EnGen0166]EOH41962.1 hypothetical protein SSI_03018 [Enterococcus faecium EnGen0191]EOM17967.1 hypothetical protein SSM_03080 [Enterococcus faecium EnGen0192]
MKLKSLGFLGLFVGCVIGLTACSQAESSKKSSDKEIAFAKVAKTDEQNLWFLIEGDQTAKTPIEQDAKIDSVIVTKNGKYKMFKTEVGNLSLSDVSTMSDDEIIENAEKYDQEKFENKLQSDTNDYESILQSAKEELTTEQGREFSDKSKIKELEEKIPLLESDMAKLKSIEYQAPKWKEISVEINKGNDGEKAKNEIISLSYNYLSSPIWSFSNFKELSSEGEKVELIDNSKKLELAVPVAFAEVNKKIFTGYTNKNMETILVKQVHNKDQKMVLDEE